jgi:hypothetical protein
MMGACGCELMGNWMRSIGKQFSPKTTVAVAALWALALTLLAAGCCDRSSYFTATIPTHSVSTDRWPELVGQGATWTELRETENFLYEQHLASDTEGYQWFANSANGRAGVPFILLRLMPELFPDIFGTLDEGFSRFGFAIDARDPKRPLPLGLGWCAADEKVSPIEVVTLTCGACHIGHVRLENGKIQALVGAPNTQVDVRRWRHAFEQVARKIRDSGVTKTVTQVNALMAGKPPNYFYANRGSFGDKWSDEIEAKERQFVSANAEAIVQSFVDHTLAAAVAVDKQKATSYGKRNAPPLDGGTPGQSDGSGDLIPKLLLLDKIAAHCKGHESAECVGAALKDFTSADFAELPSDKATATDILSTWRQEDHQLAQIDGTVKSPFFRNIAAILAVVGDPSKIIPQNADISARFLQQLPPPSYPFDVDMRRAKRGRALFRQNCAVCHKPKNTVVYKTGYLTGDDSSALGIGTDPNRSQVLNADAVKLFVRYFRECVPPDFVITDETGSQLHPRSLPADAIIIDRSAAINQGYVADPLYGVWARAPYLHNGSVPTLYHLLVPSSRPMAFLRGSINYDVKNVGWQWDINKLKELQKADRQATEFQTTWDGASCAGHDRNLIVSRDGQILQTNWQESEPTNGLRVRLDWSGADQHEPLLDLLEYLKTL